MSFDTIVIGSGMGGLSAAAALARSGHRVCVLEQHSVPGGMTQTFQREDFRFGTGLHYIGGCADAPGEAGMFARLMRWLGDGTLRFAPLPQHFDVVRLLDPALTGGEGEIRFAFGHPEEDNLQRLRERFPADARALDGYVQACQSAVQKTMLSFPLHGMPRPLTTLVRWVRGGALQRSAQQTLEQALAAISNPVLRCLLGARGGDYGLTPSEAPLGMHALVLGSYRHGAWYPVGGTDRLAHSLAATVQAAGGELRTGATVHKILIDNGRATGVQLDGGETLRATHIVSAMGALNTLNALPADTAPDWQDALRPMPVSRAYLALYVGLSGDPREAGIDGANHWIYRHTPEQMDWIDPTEGDAPSMFVSFGSLNDPEHQGGHTAELIVPVPWSFFSKWAGSDSGHRPEDYAATKAWIADSLLRQFGELFPGLRERVVLHELATPLSHAHYARAPQGAMYGLRITPQRLLAPELHTRTPVPGLLLAGQDVASLGIEGATMGGLMAAASLEPKLWTHIRP